MIKPIPGKLYNIVSTFKVNEEASWVSGPMELYVFASVSPWGDIENTGVSIESNTTVVYLGEETYAYSYDSPWEEENRVYFKILLPDSTVAYVLDDGYCEFVTPKL